MVGGTGLYIKAFCEGLDVIPSIPDDIRSNILNQYKEHGISFLQQQLQQEDLQFWKVAEQQNPQRLMRALEVLHTTGKSILYYQNKTTVKRPFNIIKICLQLPRNSLYERINLRVDNMMAEGLLEEAKRFLPYENLNALQTVGYKELFDFLNGKTTLQTAIDFIKQNTRHYAKRQLTWFKKDNQMNWFEPEEFDKIINLIKDKI